MRRVAAAFACAGALAATPTVGAGTAAPAFRVDFSGRGTQHVVDVQRYIDDTDGSCFARERIDETAQLAWSTSAPKLTTRVEGASVAGTGVRDSCDGPPGKAPADWLRQTTCGGTLDLVTPVTVAVTRTRRALVVDVAGPNVAAAVGSNCALVVRVGELVAHVSVPLAKLNRLARGRSVSVAVGTARPGGGVPYRPHVDCSRPLKPYEGYKVADTCSDDLTWSGTVRITRV